MRKVLVAVLGACLLAFVFSTQVAHALDVKLCPPGSDAGSCTTYGSIQAAVDAAKSNSVIILPAGVHTETVTISNRDLTIRGAGYNLTTVQASRVACAGGSPDRVFTVFAARVKLQDLAIRNGCVLNQPQLAAGGGIWNSGALTLLRVTVSGNTVVNNLTADTLPAAATPLGGGIYNVGSLDVIDSAVILNSAVSNTGNALGGGIYNNGRTNIRNSTIAGNRADSGRGDETPGYGGGVYNAGFLYMEYATIARNDASTAGGGLFSVGEVEQVNSLLAGNSSPAGEATCSVAEPPAVSAGTVSTGAASTDAAGQEDPDCDQPIVGAEGLGELEDSGNGYIVMPPDAAIDAGRCLLSRVTADQRGFPRSQGQDCEIGAVEVGIMFAPVIFAAPPMPDLIVKSVKVEPSGQLNTSTQARVTVEIQNAGNKATDDIFYIDLFINPRETPPNHGGTSWFQLCRTDDCKGEEGIIWRSPMTLLPGETFRFTSDIDLDQYVERQSSRWDKYFPAGDVRLWVIVDSYEVNRATQGIILERREDNNRYEHPKFVVTPSGLPSAAGEATAPTAPPAAPSPAP